MKKTKLLTSVAALALVLSLGACNQPEDDSTGSEETSSETSSSSSSTSTEPETVTLTNYTLSITLKDEAGEPVAIPFYDSVYICGSWDSWGEWGPLTNIGTDNEPILTTTFATIKEGTYEFKGVVGLTESGDPDWTEDWPELIVAEDGKSNATFTVNAEDGDNYTNNLEFTVDATKVPVLEETPMTEAEIITAILAAAEKADDEGLGWAAFKGVETDSTYDEEVNAYLTTDDNDNLYGAVFDYEDDELSFEYYYVDGVEYSHGLTYDNYFTEDDPEDFECGENLEDALEWYLDGFEPFPYLSYEDREDWVLGHEEGSSIYTLAIPGYYTDTLTLRRAGDDFEIIAVSEVADGEEVSAELITAADVEAQMGGFDAKKWREPIEDVEGLLTAISEGQNFTITIEYFEYFTDIYSSSAEAQNAWGSNYYYQDLWVEMTFTEDAVLMEYYTSYYGYLLGSLFDVELYVNTQARNTAGQVVDATAVYWIGDDGETLELQGYYNGHWQDNSIGSYILDLVNYTDHFTAGETTEDEDYGTITEYEVTKNDCDFMEDIVCGLLWAYNSFGTHYSYGINAMYNFLYYAQSNAAYFDRFSVSATYYHDYEELDVEVDTGATIWTNSSQQSWVDQSFMLASVYNVGISEIPEEYASYLA